LLAMRLLRLAVNFRPPSPASRLLQGFALGARFLAIPNLCRSQLAGDEALEACGEFQAAFAGKPAPTGLCVRHMILVGASLLAIKVRRIASDQLLIAKMLA